MITLRMVKGLRCHGCGSTGRVDVRTNLCASCAGVAIEVADRKKKLDDTLARRWGTLAKRVRLQIKEFNEIGKVTEAKRG